MIKLKNILVEEKSPRTTFTTDKQYKDPETGRISWKVTYHPSREVEKGLDVLQDAMERLSKENPQDLKLNEYYDTFKKYKKSLNTFLNRQYPKK